MVILRGRRVPNGRLVVEEYHLWFGGFCRETKRKDTKCSFLFRGPIPIVRQASLSFGELKAFRDQRRSEGG